MKLHEVRAVLTGASGGIGQAAAAALVEAGASVLLVGRSPAGLSAQAGALASRTASPRSSAEWCAADVTHPTERQALASQATSWGANVVVHGAGVPAFGRFDALDTADIERVIQVNLVAPMLLTHALLPHLRRQSDARVVCVGSVLGRIGIPGFSAYNASKFGLRGFAESLRRELADSTVKVQYLGPRSTRTAFNSEEVDRFNAAVGSAVDPVGVAAQALLDLLAGGAAERFIGHTETLAVRINGLAPTWLDKAFTRHRRCLPDRPRQ